VQGAQVRVLEQVHQERLGGLLEGLDGMRLPTELGAALGGEDIECDFTDESREGELLNEEVI
jgi:hypothetical protein